VNKNLLLVTGTIVVLCTTSCVKKYDCHCTYVPSSILGASGQNINEHSSVKARILEDARFECEEKESKYYNQNYTGTCDVD